MALFGHSTCTGECPLSGAKQTSLIGWPMSANDPKRTLSSWCGCPGSADEERRGADQGTVVDLPHEEVRDIRTADRTEAPIL
jgi:hypothetical protein